MKQKLRALAFVLLILPCVACGQKLVTVKVTVIDEQQQPVPDADVGMSFLLDRGANNFKGKTDAKGKVSATRLSRHGVDVAAWKDDYYRSYTRTGYGNQDITFVLREKKNPIPMYVKKVTLNRPSTGKSGEPHAYDLMVGDFVKPYGKGVVNDFYISFNSSPGIEDASNYEYRIVVQFPNEQDGLIPFYIDETIKESEFRSDYLAPTTGYQNRWVLEGTRVGDLQQKKPEGARDEMRNYYFRVRSVVNDEGELVSAHYGKIYGEFLEVSYFFNPTPNDRNIEFDILKNLFKKPHYTEEVWVP